MGVTAATASAALEPGYVKQRAAALVRDGRGARVLLIHARPHWDGEPSFTVRDAGGADRVVRVRAGVSQLAILDAYADLPESEYLVVLTDRSRQDLGDAVLLRAWRREAELPDVWNAVPALFGAREVSRELRRKGVWVPNALLAHAPAAGWPTSPGPEVSASWALENLIAHLLGLSIPEELDADAVLGVLGEPAARARWAAVDPALRDHLAAWAQDGVGPAVAFALRVAGTGRAVSPLAVGLAVDVLWGQGVSAVERGIAQARLLDHHYGSPSLPAPAAREIAEASRSAVTRRLVSDPDVARNVLLQAEALLGDLGWADGAAESVLLPAGFAARLRALGAALGRGAADAEDALAAVHDHALATPDRPEVVAARSAVRLARWLATPEADASTFSSSLRRQVDDGAWVDRAVNGVWNATDDPVLAASYEALLAAVRVRRGLRDQVAAAQLAAYAATPVPLDGAIPIEGVLQQVVRPWSQHGGVLVVVLDGMSMAIATEVTEVAQTLGFAEFVPTSTRRMSAIAVLPSLTELSRASLLSGGLADGPARLEKKAFAGTFPGAVLFHKDELRAGAGAQLTDAVSAAIKDVENYPVVGVVINTIDDTMHHQDPSSMVWTVERLAPLRALLLAAAGAGRTIVLSADHGHIVEHATEGLSAPTGASARWRPSDSGPVRDGEVLVRGPRVLTNDREAVLLWRSDAHYGPRYPGYHGGASLAEITVPVIVLRPVHVFGSTTAVATGWVAAPPQAPEWWNETARPAPKVATVPERKKASRKPATSVKITAPTGDQLFDVVVETNAPAPQADLVEALLVSPRYVEQKTRAGRRSAPDADVATVLRTLLARGGRAHRDTVAGALGVANIEPVLAAIKRVLNVDGYAVLQSVDNEWLQVATDLLEDQFGV